MPCTWRIAGTTLAVFAALTGCGGREGGVPAGPHGSSGGSPIAERRSDDKPPLVLVARSGDPNGAVAFAAASDGGSVASAAAAAFLATRLREQGFADIRPRAQGLGFTLEVAVETGADARHFVEAVTRVLATPVRSGEPGLAAAQAALVTLGARRFPGPGIASVAECSGELGLRAGDPLLDPTRLPSALAGALASARSVHRGAFAAVGPADVLDGVERALASADDWPKGTPVNDAWPDRGMTAADFASTESRRLSVALRVPSPGGAFVAADALGAPRATLGRRLEALRPPWRLERVSATTRPRGACLRVDALPPSGDPGPTGLEVARVLALVSDEVDRELADAGRSSRVTSAPAEALLRPTDPGDAAAAAAWSGVAARLPAGAARRFIGYQAPLGDRTTVDLAKSMADVRDASAKGLLETRVRAEPGQSSFWALVASTCGTAGESLDDAGEAASLVSALALVGRDSEDVVFEPWIASDGVGILAHALRRSASEAPADQARRVAAALGDLIATTRPTPAVRLGAQDELIAELGRSPRPGLALVLEELSQGHPSWLEPRGSFAALGASASKNFDAVFQHWLASPLRLAVLANADASQSEAARRELERWLLPVRSDAARCPPLGRVDTRTGEVTLTTTPGEVAESAYVGIPLTRFDGRPSVEARAALFLMNRSGGWLERALVDVPAAASATVLGGPRASALVVRLSTPADQRDAALARIRALLDRFPSGIATAQEVAIADKDLDRTDGIERRDPRRRVVELWRGSPALGRLDAARLAKFLAELGKAGRLVVVVTPPG